MNLVLKKGGKDIPRADLLVLFLFAEEKPSVPAPFRAPLEAATDDLPVKFRQTLLLYPTGASPVRRLLLVGAGKREELDAEALRRLAALARNRAAALEANSLVLRWRLAAASIPGFDSGAALAEGLALAAYKYTLAEGAKGDGKGKGPRRALVLLDGGAKALTEARAGFRLGEAGAAGQNLARRLGDTPGNLLTPADFVRQARAVARRKSFKCTVLDEKALAAHKMNAFLGVGQGSVNRPRMVILESKPSARRKVCLIGKGLTFDSGGISLKPGANMWDMRFDMCGAAAVLGLFEALGKNLPYNVVGILGLAENMPDAAAQRPGDVVTAMDGTRCEVLNTDAEGRLVLGDCIAYARKKIKPEAIIDLATLTGACVVALGHEATGLMATHDGLAAAILAAGEATRERCWRLPLWQEYRDLIKGTTGDIRNIGKAGAGAGTITAGAFLAHFAGDTPFAHLDIAGTASDSRPRDYYQGGGAGVGVRLLLRLLHEGKSPWLD